MGQSVKILALVFIVEWRHLVIKEKLLVIGKT